MMKKNVLDALVEDNLGYLKTADAVAAGVSRAYLGDYVQENNMERVAFGLYRSQDAWDDGMFVLQTRYPSAVFSHESALFLHGLTDREPMRYYVTLKTGANSSNLSKEGVRVCKVKADIFELGLIEAESFFGHTVRVYDAERTICDIIRKRYSMDPAVFVDALQEYVRQKRKNLFALMQYARVMNIEKRVSEIMEVLL